MNDAQLEAAVDRLHLLVSQEADYRLHVERVLIDLARSEQNSTQEAIRRLGYEVRIS